MRIVVATREGSEMEEETSELWTLLIACGSEADKEQDPEAELLTSQGTKRLRKYIRESSSSFQAGRRSFLAQTLVPTFDSVVQL